MKLDKTKLANSGETRKKTFAPKKLQEMSFTNKLGEKPRTKQKWKTIGVL